MDPISAALDTCRFAEIEAGQAQSSSPWAVHMPGGVWPVSLYVFTGAGCNLYMTRSGQQNTLRDKSVCLILRAQEHIVQDALRTAPNQPVDLRNPANADRFRTLAFGESPDAGVTSTFYVGMAPAKGAGAALFDALPDVLQLDFDELPAWLCRATEAIRDELTLRRPGFRSVALRQAELIVIQLIRHYIAAHTPRLPAWISLPEDSRVALALREFHRDISRPWTLDMLASAAGTSRSRLIAAAQRELGAGIFHYMTRIRMQEASRLLTDTSMAVGRIAGRWATSPKRRSRSRSSATAASRPGGSARAPGPDVRDRLEMICAMPTANARFRGRVRHSSVGHDALGACRDPRVLAEASISNGRHPSGDNAVLTVPAGNHPVLQRLGNNSQQLAIGDAKSSDEAGRGDASPHTL